MLSGLRALFWVSEIIVVFIAMDPVVRFLMFQWEARRHEFYNRLRGEPLELYLSRYHGELTESPGSSEEKFKQWYNNVAGRNKYYGPMVLLAVVVVVLTGLVIATAIRAGYERYLIFYLDWLKSQGTLGEGTAIVRHSIAELNSALVPLPEIVLSLDSLAAISGAFMAVIVIVIQGYRARTLVPSDLLWCSFRMVIAVPLGLSLSQVANPALGAFIAFGLGAFPMEAITQLLRRLVNKTLNQTDDETADELIKLSGVTPQVAAILGGEGITAVAQLGSVDPVALAIRSGLSFDYVLDLVAQSQAWRYLGPMAANLVPLGLADARSIAKLVGTLGNVGEQGDAPHILGAAATAANIDAAVLKQCFTRIAEDECTKFLLVLG